MARIKRSKVQHKAHASNVMPKRVVASTSSWLRAILPMVLIGIMVSLSYWAWLFLTSPNTLPFKRIKIIASSNHIPATVLKHTIAKGLKGGFFSLKVARLDKAIKALPWVSAVILRREWPTTLVVMVNEQAPVALWGSKGVVNSQGVIFYPPQKTLPTNLVMLHGPDDQAKTMLAEVRLFNSELQPLGLSIKQLTLSQRLAYQTTLSNGMPLMLGRQNVDARFLRFVLLYQQMIGNKAKQVAYVDLRYPNGLAIKWRSSMRQFH